MGKLIDIDLLIKKAKIEAEGMSESFKSNFLIYVEWLAEKIPPAAAEVIGERYTVQRRTHRKYRTNKKWKKRYGVAVRYKDRIILDNINRVVYMTEKAYERMKRSSECPG